MKIVAIMPIKMNNERCPGKNIRLLGDRPLLQHELGRVLETHLCDEVYVYCSDESIKTYLIPDVIFLKRPQELDLPTSNFNQIFTSFMNRVDADIYVYVHATAPFISCETITACINAVKSGKYDSAFCAERIQSFLWKEGRPLNFDPSNLPRTQDLEPVYKETSGVYVFKKKVYLQYKRRIGIKPFIRCVNYKEAVDIDEQSDFVLAEQLINFDGGANE